MNTNTAKTEFYYLAYEKQADNSMELTPISRTRWREILRENRGKHGYDRRYFTRELHSGCCGDCWFVCEVSWEEYQEWDALRHRNRRREDKHREHISLDAPVVQDECDSAVLTGDTLADPNADTERDGNWLVNLEKLRQGLAEWKAWGPQMLDYYLAEMGRSCTGTLAQEYDCSEECIRYRKRQFRAKVMELCKKHGIGRFD